MEVELEKMKILDINKIQCFIIYNLGMEKVTIGNLTKYGYYLGENASYNLNKMIKNGYLIKEINSDDTRSSYIKLSKKGISLYKKLKDLFIFHEKSLDHQGIDTTKGEEFDNFLINLEKFWENLQRRSVYF